MKYAPILALLCATCGGYALAQAPATGTPKETQTTAQKAFTGIPYADQMNYVNMDTEKVPRDVQLSFGKAYPNALGTQWQQGEAGYRSSFQQDGRMMSVSYDATGKAQEIRTSIELDALPLSVKNSLEGKEANLPYEIRVGNDTYYSAQVEGKEMYYDKKGKPVKYPKKK